MGNKEQSEQINEQTKKTETVYASKEEEKAARKARMRERRLARRARRNARIAYGRWFKNLIIWLLGVLFLPAVIAIASFIVPIGVITGNDGKIVSQDLSKKSLFNIVKFVAGNSGELGFSDFPIVVNSLSDLQKTQIGERDDGEGGKTPITVGDIIYIDTDKLNTIKFSGDVAGNVSSCVEVIATIEKLGGASALGDFGSLNVFTDEEMAGTVADVCAKDETADERKQYYFKSSSGTVVYDAAETIYERAFNDAGELVEKLAALSETDKTVVKLYYPPLEKVKLSELKDIVGDSIGRTTISSLLDVMGGSNEKLIDIIGADRTIKGIKDFDIKTVALTNVLDDNAENAKLWNILKDVTGKTTTAEITIGDLSGINTDDIYLNTVLPAPDSEHPEQNKKLYDILLDITPSTVTAYDQIKVSDLSGLNTDNLHLTTVLADNTANAKLYNILKDLSGKTDAGDIIVEDLSGLNTDNLHLSIVLPAPDDTADPSSDEYKQNRKLYDILKDLTDSDSAADITVGGLGGLDTDKLHLNTVMGDVSTNKVLKALEKKNVTVGEIGTALNALSLYEVYGTDSFKAYDPAITSLNMNRSYYKVFDENGVALYMLESNSVVASAPSTAYYICYSASGVENRKTAAELGAVDTSVEYYKCTDQATHLVVSFQPASSLPDTSVYDYDDGVTYYHAASGDYVVSTYLATVLYKITDESSPDFFLDSRDLLIKADAYEYFACYDGETFVGYLADPTGYTYDDSVKYIKATDYSGNTVYVLDEKQYLDKDAGIWLLLSFDTAEYSGDVATRRYADEHGKAYKYDVDNMTIESLQKGSNFAKKFKNSTIKQLVDSGLIDDPNFTRQESYKYSLQELLDAMKDKGL